MTLANPLPWWALVPVIGACGWLAYRAYARVPVPVARGTRATLGLLRLLALLAPLVVFMRPVRVVPPARSADRLVPILVDASRSMQLPDGQGARRIDQAIRLVRDTLGPALKGEFAVELLAFADDLEPTSLETVRAEGSRTDLGRALRRVRERYAGRPLAGIVVLSDGADTGDWEMARAGHADAPVVAIGLGDPAGVPDREVQSVSVGDATLVESLVELTASLLTRGYGTEPFEVRVLEDRRPVHVRTVRPASDGAPTHEVFKVSPKRDGPTLYTVEIPAGRDDVVENNTQTVMVRPPVRPRRILMVQGAPGFDHSFLSRAWLRDPGLEVSTVVRKGQNDQGQDTYYVQAPAARAAVLADGLPREARALFAFDGITLANLPSDSLSHTQLELIAEFVRKRGGGLLVMGARSLERGGLANTPIEEALPLAVSDRGGVVRAVAATPEATVSLTPEGERHAVMQLGASREDTVRRWAGMPALAAVTPLGTPRPGASVLAWAARPAGVASPLVAVQRYGEGRSMVFAGEASWRWRMMLPADDSAYDTFWRQAIRWLSVSTSDPIALSTSGGAAAGDRVTVTVQARDEAFEPITDATTVVEVRGPGGTAIPVAAGERSDRAGEYRTEFRASQPGLYRIRAETRRGPRAVGTADEWVLVGGADLEFADPRLNEDVLRRLVDASGGQYLRPADAGRVGDWLRERRPEGPPPVLQDLWHNAFVLALLILLPSAEWVLRRREGLR